MSAPAELMHGRLVQALPLLARWLHLNAAELAKEETSPAADAWRRAAAPLLPAALARFEPPIVITPCFGPI